MDLQAHNKEKPKCQSLESERIHVFGNSWCIAYFPWNLSLHYNSSKICSSLKTTLKIKILIFVVFTRAIKPWHQACLFFFFYSETLLSEKHVVARHYTLIVQWNSEFYDSHYCSVPKVSLISAAFASHELQSSNLKRAVLTEAVWGNEHVHTEWFQMLTYYKYFASPCYTLFCLSLGCSEYLRLRLKVYQAETKHFIDLFLVHIYPLYTNMNQVLVLSWC